MTTAHQVMARLQPSHRGPAVERLDSSPFFIARSWELVAEATSRPDDFSSNLTATMVIGEDGNITEFPVAELGSPIHALATADGQAHRLHRKLVLPSLSPRTLRSWAPFVTSTLKELWAEAQPGVVGGSRVGGGGSVDGGDHGERVDDDDKAHAPIDWMSAIAERLPTAVVAELIGIPRERRDDLLRRAFASTRMLDGVVTADELNDAVVAVGEFMAFLDEHLHQARTALPSTVLGDLARLVNNAEMDHDVAIQVLIQLIVAGIESTVGHLGALAWRLGQYPEHLDAMRRDDSLRPAFIEEVLRLDSPFLGHYRHVIDDTELGGVALPAGSHLFLMWGGANRDEGQFDRADEFLPQREDSGHLAFGRGIHFCVGAALARLESRAALDFLLDLGPTLRIDSADAEWQPSLLVRRLRSLRVSA